MILQLATTMDNNEFFKTPQKTMVPTTQCIGAKTKVKATSKSQLGLNLKPTNRRLYARHKVDYGNRDETELIRDSLWKKRSKRDLVRENLNDYYPQAGTDYIPDALLPYLSTNFSEDDVCKILEGILFLASDIFKEVKAIKQEELDLWVNLPQRIILPVARFLSQCSGKSILSILKDGLHGLSFDNFIKNFFFVDELIPQSSDDYIGTMEEGLGMYLHLRNSAIYKQIYKLIMYVLSFNLLQMWRIDFDSLKFDKMHQEAIRLKYHSREDFMVSLVQTIIFILKRGHQTLKTGDISSIFHSADAYGDWYNDCQKLKQDSKFLSDPSSVGIVESKFFSDLKDAIKKGDDILKYSDHLDKFEVKQTRILLNEMKTLDCDLTIRMYCLKTRKVPLSLLIYGSPAIGKSSILEILFLHFAKTMKLPTESRYRYTRTPGCEYWDNFESYMHTTVFDDAAATHPNKSAGVDDTLKEFIQVMNNVPFMTNQAAIEKKGTTPFRSKLVLASTNIKNLNAYHYFSCPSAVQRRFPYVITPRVKPQFAKQDGTLDTSKCVPINGEYDDYWFFKIEKPILKDITKDENAVRSQCTYETILDGIGMPELIVWYVDIIKAHELSQDLLNLSVINMTDINVCESCSLPKYLCKCTVLTSQSADVVEVLLSLWIMTRLIDYILSFYLRYRLVRAWYSILEWIPLLGAWFTQIRDNLLTQYTNRRPLFEAMGRRAQSAIGTPAVFAYIVGLLTTTVVVIKLRSMFQKCSYVSQGSSFSSLVDFGQTPGDAEDDTKEAVWYKDEYTLTSFDMTPQQLSKKAFSVHEFASHLNNNLVHCTLKKRSEDDTGWVYRRFHAVALRGQIYITNNHNMWEGGGPLHVITNPNSKGINLTIDFDITENEMYRDLGNDYVVFVIPHLPPRKDITNYFAKESFQAKTNGILYGRNQSGQMVSSNVENIHRVSGSSVNIGNGVGRSEHVWLYAPYEATKLGDCGKLVIGSSHYGPAIVGIHAAGDPNCNSLANSLSKEKAEEYLQCFNSMHTVAGGQPKLSAPSKDVTVGDLHKKATVRYVPQGHAEIYGSFVGFRQAPKSLVQRTILYDEALDMGWKERYFRPKMNTWEPKYMALQSIVQPAYHINLSILDTVRESFTRDIISRLTPSSWKKLHVYDVFTSVNGARGVNYVDKIKMSTSAGNPWKKSKEFFIRNIPPDRGLDCPVEVDNEILSRCADMIERYRKGERCLPNFCAHLKDEPVSLKKVKSGKIRVFTGCPFDFTIVVRMFYLSFVRVIQSQRYVFESAIGIITTSSEWGEMYDYLTRFGDNIVAGDYKDFDKKMPACVIRAAFQVMVDVAKVSGNYTGPEIQIMESIAMDVAFPLVDYFGDLMMFLGMNPSGHPLTVIINGLVNCLYIRYAYYKIVGEVDSFKDNVSLIVYGDDNAMGVNREVVPNFHHANIAKVLQSFGVTYTTPDKSDREVDFISIKQTSFLKRYWRWDSDVSAWLCPLERDSIEKRIMTWVKSKSITPQEQAMEVIEACARDYFEYGKEEFTYMSNRLRELVSRCQLTRYITDSTFPTWDSLAESFWSRSNRGKKRLESIPLGA